MTYDCDVAIVGGGPAGLMLAIELGSRGVSCALIDEKPGTTTHPQAHATQARTMEHYRRLGFAAAIRALGLPPDYPTDVVYFTRFNRHELARLNLPTARQAADIARTSRGSWSTPELPHRCPLLFVEPELLRQAKRHQSVTTLHGWRMADFDDDGEAVTLSLDAVDGTAGRPLRCRYLVGCDGARSLTRRKLGIKYEGESRFSTRAWMGGAMYSLYFRAPGLYAIINGPPAWMYFTLNPACRCTLTAVNGIDTFVLNVQLRPSEQELALADLDECGFFREVFGVDHPIERLDSMTWHGGHCLVADRYASGRVFIAGDAAHLFSPTGGLGYNTAVEDVVNLGWKLAGAVKGWAGPKLLASYDLERRAIGLRNTALARAFADRIGLYAVPEHLEDEDARGTAIRAAAGDFLQDHLRREFSIPGITFGVRYDHSPITISDGTVPPDDSPNQYVPTASPGGRAPHAWLQDGCSLFDRFGADYTLLDLGGAASAREAFATASQHLGLPLKILSIADPDLWSLYEADLVLIRPDQHICWRSRDRPCDAAATLATIAGH